MIFGCKKGRKYSNYLIYTLCCGEGGIGYCADYVGLLRLTPFPTARRRGPCKPNCAKSGKPCLLFPIPLSTSKLVPRYKKQKVSNFSIPFCFVILRRGRDSNPRNSCPFTAFRVRPDRPLRHLSNCECKYRDNFLFPANLKGKKLKKVGLMSLKRAFRPVA